MKLDFSDEQLKLILENLSISRMILRMQKNSYKELDLVIGYIIQELREVKKEHIFFDIFKEDRF